VVVCVVVLWAAEVVDMAMDLLHRVTEEAVAVAIEVEEDMIKAPLLGMVVDDRVMVVATEENANAPVIVIDGNVTAVQVGVEDIIVVEVAAMVEVEDTEEEDNDSRLCMQKWYKVECMDQSVQVSQVKKHHEQTIHYLYQNCEFAPYSKRHKKESINKERTRI